MNSTETGDPFANCRLDRKRYALALTKLIEGDEGGTVIALNNKWGAGKTTFVNMWKNYLESEGFSTEFIVIHTFPSAKYFLSANIINALGYLDTGYTLIYLNIT